MRSKAWQKTVFSVLGEPAVPCTGSIPAADDSDRRPDSIINTMALLMYAALEAWLKSDIHTRP